MGVQQILAFTEFKPRIAIYQSYIYIILQSTDNRYKGKYVICNNFKNLLKIWEGERGLISHSVSSPLKDLNYIPSIHSFSPMI